MSGAGTPNRTGCRDTNGWDTCGFPSVTSSSLALAAVRPFSFVTWVRTRRASER